MLRFCLNKILMCSGKSIQSFSLIICVCAYACDICFSLVLSLALFFVPLSFYLNDPVSSACLLVEFSATELCSVFLEQTVPCC